MSERTIFSPKDVFISWNHLDVDAKNTVKAMIEEKGYSVWESDFECAGSIREACLDHIPLCGVFLILVTPNSIKSNWVKDELETAMQMEDGANRIVPVVLGVPEGEYGVLTAPMTALWRMTSGIVGESVYALPSLEEKIVKNVQDLSMNRDFAIYRQAVICGRNAPCSDYIPRHLTKFVGSEAEEIHENDFISALSPAFIYADGGCGKTQFLNRVLSVLTKEYPQKLIFKVNCTSLVGQSDFVSAVYEQFSTLSADSHYEKRHFEALLRYKAKDMVVLVDAADEVGKEYHLTSIGECIADFRSRFPEAIFIYTARTESAAKRLLGNEGITKYELKRFSGEDIRRYSFIKFSAEGQDGNDFYLALSTIDEEIKGNPFLLKWLVEIYQRRGMVPDSVSRILDEVTDIVVGGEDIARHPEMLKDYSENEKKYIEMLPELLKRFAYERYLADYNELKINSRALLRDVICTYRVPKAEAEELSGTLLSYTEKRSITVQDQFAHKIFLEYFASCYLYDEFFNLGQVADEEEIEDYFREYYFEPYWFNPTLLLLCRASERAKKAGIREMYHIAAEQSKGDFDLLFKAANMSKNSNGIKKILLGELMDGTLAGSYAPYGELFYYVEQENLYRALITLEADRLPEDTPKATLTALSIVRDVCYIAGGFRHVKELCKDEDVEEAYQSAVEELPKGERAALSALFYGAEPAWLKGYLESQRGCTAYPYFFNAYAVFETKEQHFGAYALDQLFVDELGLWGMSKPNKLGQYVGLVTLPYTKELENALTRDKASRVSGIVLTAGESSSFEKLSMHKSGVTLLCLPPNIDTIAPGAFDHFGAAKQKAFTLILPYGIKLFNGALSGIPHLEALRLPDNLTVVSDIKSCKALQVVHFPKNTVAIDEHAFERCTALKSLVLPDGLEEIGNYAFANCTGLVEVVFPASLKYIGKKQEQTAFDRQFATSLSGRFEENTFYGCRALQSVVIPEGVEEIGNGVFVDCTALSAVQFPESLVAIHDSAFIGCSGLRTITIPNTVTYLGSGAFFECKSLESITFGEGLTVIPPYGCFGCDALTEIALPKALRSIGQGAFGRCISLEEITLPDGLEGIDYQAFRRCESLGSVHLPQSVKKLGSHTSGMFMSNSSTLFGKVMAADEGLAASFRALAGTGSGVTDKAFEKGVFAGCLDLTEVCLPDEMETVGDYLFDGCKSLRSVKMPHCIQSIGKGTFQNCRWIREVNLPEVFGSLGEGTFKGCKNIESVRWTYPYPIPDETFMGCTGLEEVYIAEGTPAIGERAFAECTYLEQVALPQKIKIGEDAFRHCIFSCSTKTQALRITKADFPDGKIDGSLFSTVDRHAVEEIEIEEGITDIGECTFKGCEKLQKVTLPSTLLSIGNNAFQNCVSLKAIDLPEGVSYLGEYAFSSCASLERLELPDSITDMGSSVFTECISLSYVKWTKGMPKMPSCVFANCTALSTLILPPNLTELCGLLDCHGLTHLDLPEGLESIGQLRGTGFESFTMPNSVTTLHCNIFGGTFQNCKNLKSIRLSENVTKLGSDLFKGCTRLKEIIFPPVVRSIDYCAFEGCTSLTHLTLPSQIVKIHYMAFQNCTGLKSVTFGEKLLFICHAAFSGCTSLKEVTFKSQMKRIEEEAFMHCQSLESILLPDSIREMGHSAFCGCLALKNITLPASLEQVPAAAFANCLGLETIVLPKGLYAMSEDAFRGTSPAKVTLPASLSYLVETCWGKPMSVSAEDSEGQITAVFKETT